MADVIFDEKYHTFTRNGERLPSVTQILNSVGMYKDLDNIPRSVLAWAAERGKIVHKIIEMHEQGILDETSIDGELQGYFSAYLQCVNEYSEVFSHLHEFEKMLYSDKYNYCGIYDAGGEGWIIDYKTTAMTSPVHGLQLTAYWLAEHPDFVNDKPKGLACVYLNKSGRGKFIKYDFQPLQWIACLNIFNWKKRNGVK